ncbi:putative bifunctional diguanylate cyclase/phosphodiesterase [Marinobacter caseinilyticus]|uniref:putative bifunctional diguanylate cyclase/phosphodiesterase n=1 Tax=Marinobacter caseinilyticus TaxID=2692195 RepID=UPI0014090E45|nr:EAL domain-containing protein [Marinobacter caseinilyticus]
MESSKIANIRLMKQPNVGANNDDQRSAWPVGTRNPRALLAVSNQGNRLRLKEQFQPAYEIIDPHSAQYEALRFDIAIVDVTGLKRWHTSIQEAKFRDEPTFLPVILILSAVELKQRLHYLWDLVDEFIVTPIDRLELSERVGMLMRARHLALTQQEQLAFLVTHDRITKLPNKQKLAERLTETINDASVLKQTVRLVVIKLDLRKVLDSLGHQALDEIAVVFSDRLQTLMDSRYFTARLTTDTWSVTPPPEQSLEALMDFCQRVQSLTQKHLIVLGEKIHIELSVAVGAYPDDASDASHLMDCAINALGIGGGGYPIFYSRTLQHDALRFIRTEARLRGAVGKNQFELWYQPKVDLKALSVTNVEALVRWRLPGGALVPPGEFLSVAEATGLIVDVDRWVLDQACADIKAWRADGVGIQCVAINITPADLKQDDFVDGICRKLAEFGLPPEALELELTESMFMECEASNLDKLNQLRALGIEIAIDDFGTGYSSLSYLHKLPVSVLKIDQSFVRDILTDDNSAAITKTVIWLAKNFNLRIVAEGVETEEQAEYLRENEVDVAQGYFYARPMPESQLREWLINWKP